MYFNIHILKFMNICQLCFVLIIGCIFDCGR